MRYCKQAISSLAVLSALTFAAVLGSAASAAAVVISGPTYTLTGGGSCSISGQPSRGTGATVTCSGVNLAAHTNVYFGIKNNSIVNGNATDGSGPSGGEVFSTLVGSTASSITYGSTSSIVDQINGNQTVTNRLVLTLTAGAASVVSSVGAFTLPPNNGNGAIDRLFKLNSGSSFTFDVDVNASDPFFALGNACPAVYDPTHTSLNNGDLSSVDVAFYYSDCGDGTIDSPEICDDGGLNGTAGSCCTTSCTYKTAGTACSDDGNVCTDDQCNGASSVCQHPNNSAPCNDGVFCNGADTCVGGGCGLHAGDPCTGADGDGNCSESCNEAADNCTAADPNGSACTDSLFCNGADTCSGGTCSSHVGDPCTGADGDGDCSESCDEGADNCLGADPNGSGCTDGLFCNGTDNCSGGTCSTHTGDPCPGADGDTNCAESCDEGADNCLAIDPDGTLCRPGSGDACDPDETCSSGSCPADTVSSNGTICRNGSGDSCDEDEACTGVAGQACPADDAPGNSGVICRLSSAGDACDLSETCTGNPGETCPADDAPGNAGVECRAAAGECDVAEQCTGNPNESCPADGFVTSGTACTDDGEICTTDLCDGAGTCAHDPGNAGTSCRASAQACDAEEVCDGIVGSCPADVNEPDGTSCSDGEFCNGPEECQSGTCTDTADPCPILCNEGNDTCTVACGDEPMASCRTAAKSILLFKEGSDDSKDKLIYKFIKGAATVQADFGTPLSSTDYALCIYAGTTGMMVGTTVAVFDAVVQDDTANWKAISTKGYKYKDSTGADDGIQKVILKGSSPDAKTKILVKGRGINLPDLDTGILPFQTANFPIIAQVTNSETGVCWESTFSQANVKKNVATQFKAKAQ